MRSFWDPKIIFGINYFRWRIHAVVCGIKTPIKREDMHKFKDYPKIDLHFGHHDQIPLKEKVFQETYPCCLYDHSIFSCMSIGLDSAPMASPSYMRRSYNKLI